MTGPPLLDRRLLLVSGKGGVGKTTVAVVLARLAARTRARVRLVGVGTDPPEVAGVASARIDGRAALDEYLGRVLPGRVHRRLVRNRRYQRLSAGAPGLFDLMVLGKIADDAREGMWDLVIADAGASGHTLQMLGMPAASMGAFGAGRVLREVTRIRAELADPRHTALVAVTTPEDLAIDEVGELVAGARGLGVAVGPVVVDRIHVCPRELAALPSPGPDTPPLLAELLRRGRDQARRAGDDLTAIRRLGPLADEAVRLPELIGAGIGEAELELLTEIMGAAPPVAGSTAGTGDAPGPGQPEVTHA